MAFPNLVDILDRARDDAGICGRTFVTAVHVRLNDIIQ